MVLMVLYWLATVSPCVWRPRLTTFSTKDEQYVFPAEVRELMLELVMDRASINTVLMDVCRFCAMCKTLRRSEVAPATFRDWHTRTWRKNHGGGENWMRWRSHGAVRLRMNLFEVDSPMSSVTCTTFCHIDLLGAEKNRNFVRP